MGKHRELKERFFGEFRGRGRLNKAAALVETIPKGLKLNSSRCNRGKTAPPHRQTRKG
jgi:hypothetical protein